jgi:hypothetical protein
LLFKEQQRKKVLSCSFFICVFLPLKSFCVELRALLTFFSFDFFLKHVAFFMFFLHSAQKQSTHPNQSERGKKKNPHGHLKTLKRNRRFVACDPFLQNTRPNQREMSFYLSWFSFLSFLSSRRTLFLCFEILGFFSSLESTTDVADRQPQAQQKETQ